MQKKIGRPKKLKRDQVRIVAGSVPPDMFIKFCDVMKAKQWTKSKTLEEMIGAFNA
jgi:hypothetical protein